MNYFFAKTSFICIFQANTNKFICSIAEGLRIALIMVEYLKGHKVGKLLILLLLSYSTEITAAWQQCLVTWVYCFSGPRELTDFLPPPPSHHIDRTDRPSQREGKGCSLYVTGPDRRFAELSCRRGGGRAWSVLSWKLQRHCRISC